MFGLFDREDKKDRDDNAGSYGHGLGSLFSSRDDLKKKQAEEDKEWDRLIDLDTLGFFDDDEEK